MGYKCLKCGEIKKEWKPCSLDNCNFIDEVGNITNSDFGFSDIKHPPLRRAKEYKRKPIKRSKMKKLLSALKRTITAENKTGQLIHGVLDLFPIPNQVLAKGVKYLATGNKAEAKAEFAKLISVRNIAALAGCAAYFAGWITLDDLKGFVDFVLSIANS